MSSATIRELIGAHLSRVHSPAGIIDTSELYLELFDAAAPIGFEAVTGCGVGMDHVAGERVLAGMLLRDTPKGHEHRLSAAITDSRTVLSGWSSIKGGFNSKRASVPHADLTNVEVKESLLSTLVRLHANEKRCELTFGKATAMLGAFYRSVGQIPAAARIPPPTDFVVSSAEDPSGATGAAQRLYVPDERAGQMLGQIGSGVAEGGVDPAAGTDMVRRIVLAHRTRCGGPGMFNRGWLSPMSTHDFGHALVSIFGQPVANQPTETNMCLDFRLDPRRDYAGMALKSLGVASHIVLGIGFSPAKMIAGALMKKAAITQLRLLYNEHEAMTRYTMLVGASPLEQRDSMLAHRLHQALVYTAYSVLERRCALGWGPGYAELFA